MDGAGEGGAGGLASLAAAAPHAKQTSPGPAPPAAAAQGGAAAAGAAARGLGDTIAAAANAAIAKKPKDGARPSDHSLFIGGLPYDWGEEQVRQGVGRTSRTPSTERHASAPCKQGSAGGSSMGRAPGHALRSLAKCCSWRGKAHKLCLPSLWLGVVLKPPPFPLAPSCCLQVRQLLEPYGALQTFRLAMDKSTGNFKVGAEEL